MLIGICPNELKTMPRQKPAHRCLWKLYLQLQPRFPSVVKLWLICTIEYYSATKWNEPTSHKKDREGLSILLSEWSQSKITAYHMIPTIWDSCKGKIIEIVKTETQWDGGMCKGGF